MLSAMRVTFREELLVAGSGVGRGDVAGSARRELTVTDIAGTLEVRVHRLEQEGAEFDDSCRQAARLGLAAVLCRPEAVARAAALVGDRPVAVATAVDFYWPGQPPPSCAQLREHAQRLVDHGADDLGLVISQEELAAGWDVELSHRIAALREVMEPIGGTTRALLCTDGLQEERLTDACREASAAGAQLVQGGTWGSDRTGFDQIRTMRDALPAGTLLKWATPVRSVHVLLLALAHGVDRCNTDQPGLLLRQVQRMHATGRIDLPREGRDF